MVVGLIRNSRYALLLLAVLAQLVTVLITWPLWQVRDAPVNLPVAVWWPQFSFQWAMVGSLALAALLPKYGIALHWIVLVAACLSDQFRLEPQFFGIAVLMLPFLGNAGLAICRWYLVAMWIWTGVHKFLSPEWMGHISWSLVEMAGFSPRNLHLAFAVFVAASEVALGMLAWFRPRWASGICAVVHLGIVLFLSPLLSDTNVSVIPWNLTIATVGSWVLWQAGKIEASADWRRPSWEISVAALLLMVPVGFYGGWIDRCFCHVMYSGHLPRGLQTTQHGPVEIADFPELGVPFPHERRLFKLYFARTASVGDKLHLTDPRRQPLDEYFVMTLSGPRRISAEDFFGYQAGEVAGIAIDDRQALFSLARAGVKLLRESQDSAVFAVGFTRQNYDPMLLSHLQRLPNLRQVDLSDTAISDQDVAALAGLPLLMGLGLNRTQVTDRGLDALKSMPFLEYIESDGTTISKFRGN
jgi:hypothetical protein